MNIITFEDLNTLDISISNIVGIKQRWKNKARYSYMNTKRPQNGIALILCENARYSFPDKSFIDVPENSLVYIPQNINYETKFTVSKPSAVSSLLINFTLHNSEGLSLAVGEKIRVICKDINGDFYKQFIRIIDLLYSKNNLSVKSAMYKLFIHIVSNIAGKRELIDDIVLYLENNFKSNISMFSLAAHFAVSVASLRRMFHQKFGIPPVEYINMLKIERAKELLRINECSIEMICEELAFYDVSYFYKVFKKYTGITPVKYKKSHTTL